MAREIDTGGPAFPEATDEWCRETDRYRPSSYGGMTLRDYFAAQVLTGLMSDHTLDVFSEVEEEKLAHREALGLPYHTTESAAGFCYAMADAMLKARSR